MSFSYNCVANDFLIIRRHLAGNPRTRREELTHPTSSHGSGLRLDARRRSVAESGTPAPVYKSISTRPLSAVDISFPITPINASAGPGHPRCRAGISRRQWPREQWAISLPAPRPADGVRDTAATGESDAYRRRPRRGSAYGRKSRVGRRAPPDKRRRFSASIFGVVSPRIIIIISRTRRADFAPPILSMLTACACVHLAATMNSCGRRVRSGNAHRMQSTHRRDNPTLSESLRGKVGAIKVGNLEKGSIP